MFAGWGALGDGLSTARGSPILATDLSVRSCSSCPGAAARVHPLPFSTGSAIAGRRRRGVGVEGGFVPTTAFCHPGGSCSGRHHDDGALQDESRMHLLVLAPRSPKLAMTTPGFQRSVVHQGKLTL